MTQLEKARELGYTISNYIILKKFNDNMLIIGNLQDCKVVNYYIDCYIYRLKSHHVNQLKHASNIMESDFKEILKYD